ncbi:MAG: hypothetical protein R2873_23055 [Caldilineaceae bacterium]
MDQRLRSPALPQRLHTGRFAGSFARGLLPGKTPRTGDARISGTLASLAGLEEALHQDDPLLIDLAIRRIHLLYSLIFSMGGVPLIYLGDEVGTLNDYTYRLRPTKPKTVAGFTVPPSTGSRSPAAGSVHGRRTHLRLRSSTSPTWRQETPILAGHEMDVVHLPNDHVFACVRSNGAGRLLVVANFTEREQIVDANSLRLHGLGYDFHDLIGDQPVHAGDELRLNRIRSCGWWRQKIMPVAYRPGLI